MTSGVGDLLERIFKNIMKLLHETQHQSNIGKSSNTATILFIYTQAHVAAS